MWLVYRVKKKTVMQLVRVRSSAWCPSWLSTWTQSARMQNCKKEHQILVARADSTRVMWYNR